MWLSEEAELYRGLHSGGREEHRLGRWRDLASEPSITGEEASWLSAVSTDLSQRIAWDRVLREVSLVIPSDVTLTSLTMTAPTITPVVPGVVTPAPAGAAQGFVVAGDAFSYDSVARLLSRLALVPDLSDVTLTSTGSGSSPGSASAGSSSAPGDGVQFNISAAVKGAPAPAAAAEPTPTPTPAVDTTTASSS